MPAVARELSITYGAFTVGGATERLLDSEVGQMRIEKDFTSVSVEYTFVIQQELEADFAAEIASVEAAFRIPRLNLTIAQGSSTLLSLSQSSNTGFDADPSIIKFDDIGNTGRSRVYTVRIDFGLPADNIGTSGRQSSVITVEFSESRRRTVTISGVYTALGGAESRAQYNASIATYAASILAGLGGTYELTAETADNFETDKNLEFSQTFQELIFNQANAVLDNLSIVNQIFRVTRKTVTPGDSSPLVGVDAVRLVDFDVSYEASIDATLTTDLVGIWENEIRPFIILQVETIAGGAIALLEDEPTFSFDDNTISAAMLFTSATTSGVLEFERTEETFFDEGWVFVPAWTGDRLAKFEYQGAATILQTVTIKGKEFGFARGFNPLGGAQELLPIDSPAGTRRRINFRSRRTPKIIGPIDAQFEILEFEAVAAYEIFNPLQTGSRELPDPEPFGERDPS